MGANGDEVDLAVALDELVERGVLHEDPDGSIHTVEAFEDDRRVYHDTYGTASTDVVAGTLSDLFGVSEDEARELLDAGSVTRDDLVAYMALRRFLDDVPPHPMLATMARLVVEVGPGSPVPDPIADLSGESVESFVAAHPDTVVTVWKHYCDPCDALKGDLDDLVATLPGDVAIVGVDAEADRAFCDAHDVSAAPGFVFFRDGEHVRTETGRRSPAWFADVVADVY